MAEFPKVNPKIDGNSISTFGKFPDFVEVLFSPTNAANILSAQNVGPLGAWPEVIRTIEETSTIEILGQLQANVVALSQDGANSNIGVHMITTGVNAANASALQNAIQALGTVVVGNATVGFSNVNLANTSVFATTIGDAPTIAGGQSSTFVF
ncbi:Uncharacterised protein [uncultured archaeon]|nr:Uncharacterised protein [uncultured archaeon]